MLVTNNLAVQNQPTKAWSSESHDARINGRVATRLDTMSVDEYFDELISQVHED